MNGNGLVSRQGGWIGQVLLKPVSVPNFVGIIALVVIVSFLWTRVLHHIIPHE